MSENVTPIRDNFSRENSDYIYITIEIGCILFLDEPKHFVRLFFQRLPRKHVTADSMCIWFQPFIHVASPPLPKGKGSLGESDATTDRQGFEGEEWKGDL